MRSPSGAESWVCKIRNFWARSRVRLKSSPGGSDPTLEPQLQPWRLKSSPGGPNPALEAQIQPWRFKSSPGDPNPALEAALEAHINPALEAQVQSWKLESSSLKELIRRTARRGASKGRCLEHTTPQLTKGPLKAKLSQTFWPRGLFKLNCPRLFGQWGCLSQTVRDFLAKGPV